MTALHDIGVAVVGAGFIGPVHVEALRRLGLPIRGILGCDDAESQRAMKSWRSMRRPRSFKFAIPTRIPWPRKYSAQGECLISCQWPETPWNTLARWSEGVSEQIFCCFRAVFPPVNTMW